MQGMEHYVRSKWGHSYRSWHIPLTENRLRLNEAVCDMHALSVGSNDLPLLMKLTDDPDFETYCSSLSLLDHDSIHILLGRGMLPKDEAFVCGFIFGSTGRVRIAEDRLMEMVKRYLSTKEDRDIFKDGLLLGMSSHCKPLNQIDYRRYLNDSLGAIRQKLGINTGLLSAYYRKEAKRYPHARESRRLIH
jgi:hypothetical protein